MFVCGPTVYDYCHLGHARTYVAFDVIARYLRFKGYPLFFLMNITDIDERVVQKAKQTGTDFTEISRTYEKYFLEDLRSLGVNSVDAFARASDHIPEIIAQIRGLIKKRFAYDTTTGVYFNVKKSPRYGLLSRTRGEISLRPLELCSSKRRPEDFSLWRKTDEDPKWDSPWGFGRPGWHIEDTAIAMKFFGSQYDIHGGASELVFPHHEAEIVQAEAFTGKRPYVEYWLHTGLLNIGGRKMSKSRGNMICNRDILKSYDFRVLRFYLTSHHYRHKINFGEARLKEAGDELRSQVEVIDRFRELSASARSRTQPRLVRELEGLKILFMKAMDDDFDTPTALRVIQRMINRLRSYAKRHREIDRLTQARSLAVIQELADIFGIL